MKILVVAATPMELSPWLLDVRWSKIHFLITGMGATNTAASLSARLSIQKYDWILNVGIAGSYKEQIPIATCVEVVEDRMIEVGAEDGDGFISFSKSVMQKKSSTNLPKVVGNTVNRVSGSQTTILQRKHDFPADIESMEGAAFMQVADQYKMPYTCIRSISNRVEVRNKKNWNIEAALNSLEACVTEILISKTSLL